MYFYWTCAIAKVRLTLYKISKILQIYLNVTFDKPSLKCVRLLDLRYCEGKVNHFRFTLLVRRGKASTFNRQLKLKSSIIYFANIPAPCII